MRRTNSLVAKAIDMDISFFAQSLHAIARGEENNTCHSDDDCNFVACQVKCNRKTNHCAGVLSSNNLKVRVPLVELCKQVDCRSAVIRAF